MSAESECPKCGSPATGRHRVTNVETGDVEEGLFFECGTLRHDDGELSQTINDCRIRELEAQLTAAKSELAAKEAQLAACNAEVEGLRGALSTRDRDWCLAIAEATKREFGKDRNYVIPIVPKIKPFRRFVRRIAALAPAPAPRERDGRQREGRNYGNR